jgi:alkanesulfonate monooxygenase SsuD/methylene tetrahydromethanopterin reductase-like flavin-dependent oxidoreductase (luciferase family)
MTTTRPNLHLAVALDGAGWHPAAWREPDARPAELLTAGYWVDLVREAQAGLIDFATIEDAFTVQSSRPAGPDGRTDQVRGRLDATLIAARVAPATEHIGLVPTVTTAHTEPFHVAKAIATLDYVSTGRAGWRVKAGGAGGETDLFGRRTLPAFDLRDRDSPQVQAMIAELFGEAADHVEVVRRLWDSWEDDAEIRDAATGRFIDRDKLHYIDFEGPRFSVRGPSITPRPPQGQPLVVALAHAAVPFEFAAGSTDVVFTTPQRIEDIAPIAAQIRAAQAAAGRGGEPLHIFADLVVFLDPGSPAAAERKSRLDDADGSTYTSDALVFTGTAAELADLLLAWQAAGLTGFRLRPGAVPHDLAAISRDLVPELQARGAFRREYGAGTLRGLLGLARPANRYAPAAAGQ